MEDVKISGDTFAQIKLEGCPPVFYDGVTKQAYELKLVSPSLALRLQKEIGLVIREPEKK
jgi:hypothetical protein